VARFAVQPLSLSGVEIKARLFRQYPYGEMASHVVGYIGRINDRDVQRIDEWNEVANYKGSDYIGKIGVELSYERELHGKTGFEEVEVDAAGRAVRTLSRTPPVSGNDLRLTIDIRCRKSPKGVRRPARRAGRHRACDGDVLAFVSKPDSIPTLRRRHRFRELGIAERFAGQAAPQSAAARRVSAGLDDQTVSRVVGAGHRQAHTDADDFRSGLLPDRRPAHRFRDDKPGGHGTVDMYKSIVASCDTYYYILASETDIDDTPAFSR
jgi:penicillin-binding protein 2